MLKIRNLKSYVASLKTFAEMKNQFTSEISNALFVMVVSPKESALHHFANGSIQ